MKNCPIFHFGPSDETIPCDTTSANFTVNLPATSGKDGIIIMIKKISSDESTLTVGGDASETTEMKDEKIEEILK